MKLKGCVQNFRENVFVRQIHCYFEKVISPKIKAFLKYAKWTSLDSYVMKMFFSSLFISLFFFIVIYQLTQIFQDLRWLPPGTSAIMLFQYYFYGSLYWIVILQPFSFLFATVYVFSRMVHFQELIAVISTGTSIYRVSFYPVMFSVFCYIFMIGFLQNSIIFPAYQQKNIYGQIIFNKVEKNTINKLKDRFNFSIFGAGQLIYIVGRYDAGLKQMENLTIVQLKMPISDHLQKQISTNENGWLLTNVLKLTKERRLSVSDKISVSLRIDANKAVWDSKNKTWVFESGIIRHVKNFGESFQVESFVNRSFDFIRDPPYYFEAEWYNMDGMTYEEGARHIEKLKKTRQDYKEDQARFLSKFSYLLGIIFIVLTGIGIIDPTKKKITFIINLMICLAIFIVYYLFFSLGISLAGKGNVSPQVGAFTGAVVFGVFSIYSYSRAKT